MNAEEYYTLRIEVDTLRDDIAEWEHQAQLVYLASPGEVPDQWTVAEDLLAEAFILKAEVAALERRVVYGEPEYA